MGKSNKKKYYGVSVGRERGIFHTWAECERQVKGYPKARFKGFATLEEAALFIGISERTDAGESQNVVTKGEQDHQKPAAKNVLPEAQPSATKRAAVVVKEEQKPPASKRQRVLQPTSTSSMKASKIASHWVVCIAFDGGARGNPGVAGSGAEVIITQRTPDKVQRKRRKTHLRKFVGTSSTCNFAEWSGALAGLLHVIDQVDAFQQRYKGIQPRMELFIQGDSQLVIRQLEGTYQCKHPLLQKIKGEFDKTMVKLMGLVSSLKVSYEHVYRSDNKVADGLANEAMDAKRSWTTELVDSSDEEYESDVEGREEDEELEHQEPPLDKKPKKVFAEV